MAIEVERRKSDVGADVRKCREAGYEEAIVIHIKRPKFLEKTISSFQLQIAAYEVRVTQSQNFLIFS